MNNTDEVKIVIAASHQEFEDVRTLFQEYANAINFDAGFKNFQAELDSLKTRYTAPDGCLLLAYTGDKAVGCIAFLKMQPDIAELKRFYVQPEFRRFKIGAKLLEFAISNARKLHFHHLRLEVIPTLIKAKQLYASFGFYPIEPYQDVEMAGTAYMEKTLLTNQQNEKQ